jgi:hypothetical protein
MRQTPLEDAGVWHGLKGREISRNDLRCFYTGQHFDVAVLFLPSYLGDLLSAIRITR